MSSDYVVRREIQLVRERQEKGERIHFYPLLLTPTPTIGLESVKSVNLRPRDARPLSSFPLEDRRQLMADVADEIVTIAQRISIEESAPSSPATQRDKLAPSEIRDRGSLETWLSKERDEVAIGIAARAALRAAPAAIYAAEVPFDNRTNADALGALASAIFRATAIARVAAKYPKLASRLYVAAAAAARATSAASDGTVRMRIPPATSRLDADPVRVDELVSAAAQATAAASYAALSLRYPLEASATAVMKFIDTAATIRSFMVVNAVSLYHPKDDGVLRAIASSRAASAANRSAWTEIASDITIIKERGLDVLVDEPLWIHVTPDWAIDAWAGLQAALSRNGNWDVWFKWYDERLRGGSSDEDYELTFASVPLDCWERGPLEANAWVLENLLRNQFVAN